MSGPVSREDVGVRAAPGPPAGADVEITPSREARVGEFAVRRALPRHGRRTVGPWCFVDHMGPAQVTVERGLGVAPHPHIGLQTVTWLLAGEGLHRDSLGSEQVLRPGQLNLMTAGRGVVHSEEGTGRYGGEVHGVQLWIAQPAATRHGAAAFEHHPELPRLNLGAGSVATVLAGGIAGAVSPARRDSDLVGADLDLRSPVVVVPLEARFEHAVVVLDGAVLIDGHAIAPGHLGYLGSGRDELRVSAREPTRALLLGGAPLDEPVLMWWNFVARTRAEIDDAYRDWSDHTDRFGPVASPMPRIGVGGPPWQHPSS